MQSIMLGSGATRLKVSELAFGCMQLGSRAVGSTVDELLDTFRDHGGSLLDTAHCYCFWNAGGDGISERLVGDYIKRHHCRDELVIATKGAHPAVPGYRATERFMTPGRLQADIDDSLGRMQIDVIDLYWLHRDDPRVPVCEILDMLNAEVARGRIRFFGGSNWTAARLDEAAEVAAAHGIDGFVCSQPRWSLLQYAAQTPAQRLAPGVLLHVDDDDRHRHAASQLPVICYGPTGNGFFANHGAAPERFRSAENIARAARAMTLANELGVTANQVALAWLRAHPFPVIPILGTADVEHLNDACGCLPVTLTAEQAIWLEHGATP
jgi:aryl-alcohol dehydrogenase-like predicted oxidoreductase